MNGKLSLKIIYTRMNTKRQYLDIKGIPSPFSAIIASVPARSGIADRATWRRFSAASAPEAF